LVEWQRAKAIDGIRTPAEIMKETLESDSEPLTINSTYASLDDVSTEN
jgi:hypothetical protein